MFLWESGFLNASFDFFFWVPGKGGGVIGRLFSFAFCWPLGVFLRIQQVARVHPLHLLVYFLTFKYGVCVCIYVCIYVGYLKKYNLSSNRTL